MSAPVALAGLVQRVEEFGSIAYLVSVSASGRPHVVSVRVAWDETALRVGAGHQTTANIDAHPGVTLLWPAPPGNHYSLIVDGAARVAVPGSPSEVVIEPTGAVLHRTPEGDPSAPACITVLEPAP